MVTHGTDGCPLDLIPRPEVVGAGIDKARTARGLLRRLLRLSIDAERQRNRLAASERHSAAGGGK